MFAVVKRSVGQGGKECLQKSEMNLNLHLMLQTCAHTQTHTTPSGKRHLKLKSGGEEIKVFPLKNTHLITLRNSVKTYSFCMFVAPTVTCTQEADVFQDSAARPKHQQWGGGVEYYIC